MPRRKALLIGINYTGSRNALEGCQSDVQNVFQFLMSRGFSDSRQDMVILTDAEDPDSQFYPTGSNIIAAMRWLVSEPGCSLFLHYSGHGGQVPDETGTRVSGFDDTIIPVDFEQNGQINSDMLHRTLVSDLPQNCTLTVILDCCHSGSCLELPFVYQTDEDGNINLLDNFKEGAALLGEASHFLQGGFTVDKVEGARHLLAGATDFFQGLKHEIAEGANGPDQEGFEEADDFGQDWSTEGKTVFMFSGCKDEQTSADAFIAGKHVGAMSWAFLTTMREDANWDLSYVQILQKTRELLQQQYAQVPQLSCGYEIDLERRFVI